MRLFIKKILIFSVMEFLLITICLLVILQILPVYESSYQASLIDKVNRLEAINKPKIILVGNSNLSFGINSKIIEDKLGMPVVNIGLHGGLGNAFHEEMAKINMLVLNKPAVFANLLAGFSEPVPYLHFASFLRIFRSALSAPPSRRILIMRRRHLLAER